VIDMSSYVAITRIRINGTLFLPGEHVYGLSDEGAAALVKAGRIEAIGAEPEVAPKGKAAAKYKATPLTPRTKSA